MVTLVIVVAASFQTTANWAQNAWIFLTTEAVNVSTSFLQETMHRRRQMSAKQNKLLQHVRLSQI